MKLITAVVTEDHLDPVAHALDAFDVPVATVFSVLSPTRPRHWQIYRGHPYPVALQQRVRIEIVAADTDTADVVHVVTSASAHGPGWLWVTPVDSVQRLGIQEATSAQAPLPHLERHGRSDG